jgi:hypothetical protein
MYRVPDMSSEPQKEDIIGRKSLLRDTSSVATFPSDAKNVQEALDHLKRIRKLVNSDKRLKANWEIT